MVVPCSEVAMSDAEKESEARCKEMLNQLISVVKKQTLEIEDLAESMKELAVGLKAVVQPLGVTAHALPPPVTAPTATLVTAVDHAVAATTPCAEAALAPKSPTKCSTSGPNLNAGYAKVAGVSLLPRGATTASRAHAEPENVSSSKSFDTGELDTVTHTRCSTACRGCNTDVPSTSTTGILGVAITSPEPSVATILVRDGTCVPTSTPSGADVHSIDLGDEHISKPCCCQLGAHQLFDEMPIRSTVVLWPPPMKWDERQLWPPPSRVVIKCSRRGMVMGAPLEDARHLAQKLHDRIEMQETVSWNAIIAGDMEDVAACFEYYAGLAEALDGKQDSPISLPWETFKSCVLKETIGVVGLITPWNYSLLMATWKVAPALAAGCTAVLKPSELVSLTSLELGAIWEEIGLPPGVLNINTGLGSEAGAPLASHHHVDKIAFTGSTETGKRIMTAAAQMVKPISLELGGKSPLIVFYDEAECSRMLGFCNHGGLLVDESLYFQQMTSRYKLEPQLEHFVCMVDVLGMEKKLLVVSFWQFGVNRSKNRLQTVPRRVRQRLIASDRVQLLHFRMLMQQKHGGDGLFREVFSIGYSVVFRCALMGNKQEAEKTETQLLRVFDYAWNKLQNGACRREEILLKLEQGALGHGSSPLSWVRHFKQKMLGEKAGIKISRSGSVHISSGIMENLLPRVRAFVGFRPQLVNCGDNVDEAIDIHWKNTSEGNTCGSKQAHGRRSEGYKGKKINVIKRRTVPIRDSNSVCGVMLQDGSCLERPAQGRKRCELHKGRRVTGNSKLSFSSYTREVEIPIVESIPRLTENASKSDQAQQIVVILSENLPTTVKESSRQGNSFEAKEVKTGEAPTEDGTYETSGDADTCRAKMSDSSVCNDKVTFGSKRCQLHDGWKEAQFVSYGLIDSSVSAWGQAEI